MSNKHYEKIQVEIITLECCDIILTSSIDLPDIPLSSQSFDDQSEDVCSNLFTS